MPRKKETPKTSSESTSTEAQNTQKTTGESGAAATESEQKKTGTHTTAAAAKAESDTAAKKPAAASKAEPATDTKPASKAKAAPASKPKPASPPPPPPDVKPDYVRHDISPLTDEDLFLFNEGNHFQLYNKLGSHLHTVDGIPGVVFAVWAPSAEYVSVIGDFNGWDSAAHPLRPRGSSGIWIGWIPGLKKGDIYKYHIGANLGGFKAEKSDPYGFLHEEPPRTASVIWDLDYEWQDTKWMRERSKHNSLNAPISIYEMHVGSWRRVPEDDNRFMTYRELAEVLPEYLDQLGFTHVEFMPITEHPFAPSWGYQTTGYFAPTSRFGTPQDFMYLVDKLHQKNIGVLLDWVPSHFPSDAHGLGYFDGTHLYEHVYPQKGWHPDWQSYIFNYGRHEVRAFLISSALYWFDKYHIDGLRVDAVASMLYLDYSRKEGEWMPNEYGGNENIEAIWFLRRLNEEIYRSFPDVQTVAEESTSWSMVSRPTYVGGLGFGMKWDMGWMHDTLNYMSKEPVHRKYHHNDLTFRMLYAWHENFCLPLSHDEVVHGKRALLDKMPGDMWQQNANLRALYGYMYAQPAKKLLFMGAEFGQWREWQHETSLDWHLLEWRDHQGLQTWVSDLNKFYRSEPSMHELDCDPAGFAWIDVDNWEQSTISLLRRSNTSSTVVVIACNFTPVPREDYRLGVPCGGYWREVLNSDGTQYGGGGIGNAGGVVAETIASHGHEYSISITIPPLGVVYFTNPCVQQTQDEPTDDSDQDEEE